eukprot:7391868-Prymnesium_polylepis.4
MKPREVPPSRNQHIPKAQLDRGRLRPTGACADRRWQRPERSGDGRARQGRRGPTFTRQSAISLQPECSFPIPLSSLISM